MNLAYGYVAQTLQMHDELEAGRVNERRRNAADRRHHANGAEATRHPRLIGDVGAQLGRDIDEEPVASRRPFVDLGGEADAHVAIVPATGDSDRGRV